MSVLSLGMYGQTDQVTVTWETENTGLTVIGPGFIFLKSGDKVASGTQLRFAVNVASGARLDKFLFNGEDRVTDMLQDKNDGEKEYAETDYMYMTTVDEDTHIKVVGTMKKFSVVTDVTGDGVLEVISGGKLEAGDKVPFGTNVNVRAVPGQGQAITGFTINGTDYLQPLLMSQNYTIGVGVEGGLMLKIEFTGEDRAENKTGKIAWNIEGDGEITVKTADGAAVERGGAVERGTEVTMTVTPAKNSVLNGFYINDDIYVTRLKENGYQLTMTVKTDMVMDAFFKSTGGGGTEPSAWIEVAADSYSSGAGTAADPYIIATPEQLSKMAADIKGGTPSEGKYYALGGDIDLKGKKWHPIGFTAAKDYDSYTFDGIFDGKGFKIKNIDVVQVEHLTTTGLFGTISGTAEVKNVCIESGTVRGENLVGAIVGYSRDGLIENCENHADVTADVFYAGGITAGNGTEGIIRNCRNYGNVTTMMCAGGICGSVYGQVEECSNFGSVSAPQGCAGGIASSMESGTVKNCYNRGTVIGTDQIGGIVGAVYGRDGDCAIYSVYSAAGVGASYDAGTLGGIVGVLLMVDWNYTFTADAMYHDADLCSAGTFGNEDEAPDLGFSLGSYAGKTTEEMKSAGMVDLLDAGTPDKLVWYADADGVNDGYPVLGPEKTGTGIGQAVSSESTFSLTSDGGRLSIEGCPAGAEVEIFGMDGSRVCRTAAGELGKVSLKQGTYIVRVKGMSQKLIVR